MKTQAFIISLFFVLILVSGLALISNVYATDYNWVNNGDFENGDLSSWTEYSSNVYATDSDSANGTYSCKIGDSYIDTKYIYMNFTGTAVLSSISELSVWAKGTDVEDWDEGIKVYFKNSTVDAMTSWQPHFDNTSWNYYDILNEIPVGTYPNCYVFMIKFEKHNAYQPIYIDTVRMILPYAPSGGGEGSASESDWLISDAGLNWLIIAITILVPSFMAVGVTKEWVPPHIVFFSITCVMACIDYAVMPTIMPIWLVLITFFATAVIFIGTIRRGS